MLEHPLAQLSNTDSRFRLLVECVKDYAIFMLDVDGHVVSWNLGAERIKGYSADEIIGSHFSRFYTEDDLAARKPQSELECAIAEGRVENEGWRVRKDGTLFWANVVITAMFDEVGELQGFAKVTRDLTERKIAEESLRESEQQFRKLIEGVEEYAIFMLHPSGHVATWNVGAERIKGYSAEEIIGRHFERFYPPEDRANGKPARLLQLAKEHGHVRDEGPRLRKDGTRFQASVVITAIWDAPGKLRGFSKVTRDITDVIRNREMENAKIAAEQANEAKDAFLAVLSHELRTPLTPVLAAVSFLAENANKLPPELGQEVDTIRRNLQLEARLIDDLLDVTKISRGKIELHPEMLDVHKVLQDALEICREDVVAKELQVSVSLEAPEHWIHGDPVRIRQVFWNVINNAVKFTPQRGSISIRSSNINSKRLEVVVSDTGIGIEEKNLARIFGAFEQGERGVTRRFGGLGLGLAITRNLVDLHDGQIVASSAGIGKGATFTVRFPFVPHDGKTASQMGGTSAPVRDRLRILLVEDHEDTRRILSRLLNRTHSVTEASDVQSALKCLAAENFDVLISDIGLPDQSGLELMRQVKSRQSLKAIALSGFGMDEDVNRSKEAGFDYHLTKPVDFQEVQAVLAELSQRP